MGKGEKVLIGVAGLTVAGLIALAVPALSALWSTGEQPAAVAAGSTDDAVLTDDSTSTAEAEYAALTERFVLPDGYSWPENAPAFDTWGGDSMEDSVTFLWACISVDAAWNAYDSGDQARADELLTDLYERTGWDRDPIRFDGGPHSRDSGYSGICAQQLGIIGYPGNALNVAVPQPDTQEYQDIGGGVQIPAKGPGECRTWAAIHPYGEGDPNARLGGTITDLGSTTYASGTVGLNADGQIATYTVAAGDTGMGIGERLCIDYVTLLAYNGKFMPPSEIHPGDVLVVRP